MTSLQDGDCSSRSSLKSKFVHVPMYQVLIEVQSKGKLITSRKKTRWIFGYANYSALMRRCKGEVCRGEECEIELQCSTQSVTSKRYKLLYNGKIVHETVCHGKEKFEHEFTIKGKNHLAKVHTPSGSGDAELAFSNLRFQDLPKTFEIQRNILSLYVAIRRPQPDSLQEKDDRNENEAAGSKLNSKSGKNDINASVVIEAKPRSTSITHHVTTTELDTTSERPIVHLSVDEHHSNTESTSSCGVQAKTEKVHRKSSLGKIHPENSNVDTTQKEESQTIQNTKPTSVEETGGPRTRPASQSETRLEQDKKAGQNSMTDQEGSLTMKQVETDGFGDCSKNFPDECDTRNCKSESDFLACKPESDRLRSRSESERLNRKTKSKCSKSRSESERPKHTICGSESDCPKSGSEIDRPRIRSESDRLKDRSESDRPKSRSESDRPKSRSESDRPKSRSESDRPKRISESDRSESRSESDPTKVKSESDRTKVKSEIDPKNSGLEGDRPRIRSESNRPKSRSESDRTKSRSESDRTKSRSESDRPKMRSESDRSESRSESDPAKVKSESDRTKVKSEIDPKNSGLEGDRPKSRSESNRPKGRSESDRTKIRSESDRTKTRSESDRPKGRSESDRPKSRSESNRPKSRPESHRRSRREHDKNFERNLERNKDRMPSSQKTSQDSDREDYVTNSKTKRDLAIHSPRQESNHKDCTSIISSKGLFLNESDVDESEQGLLRAVPKQRKHRSNKESSCSTVTSSSCSTFLSLAEADDVDDQSFLLQRCTKYLFDSSDRSHSSDSGEDDHSSTSSFVAEKNQALESSLGSPTTFFSHSGSQSFFEQHNDVFRDIPHVKLESDESTDGHEVCKKKNKSNSSARRFSRNKDSQEKKVKIQGDHKNLEKNDLVFRSSLFVNNIPTKSGWTSSMA